MHLSMFSPREPEIWGEGGGWITKGLDSAKAVPAPRNLTDDFGIGVGP